MTLNIISAEKVEFTGEVSKVTMPGALGLFTVLENHAALISSLIFFNSLRSKRHVIVCCAVTLRLFLCFARKARLVHNNFGDVLFYAVLVIVGPAL